MIPALLGVFAVMRCSKRGVFLATAFGGEGDDVVSCNFPGMGVENHAWTNHVGVGGHFYEGGYQGLILKDLSLMTEKYILNICRSVGLSYL